MKIYIIKEKEEEEVDPRFFKAILTAPFICCDPTSQKEYELLVRMKKLLKEYYSDEELAHAFWGEFAIENDEENIKKLFKRI